MAIFRGTGSAATTSDQTTIDTVTQAVVDAEAARDLALTYKTSAETAKTNAEGLYSDLTAVETAKTTAQSAAATATTKAAEAASSASDAANDATNANASYVLTNGAFLDFQTLFLGTKTTAAGDTIPPVVDNQGNDLRNGALYFNGDQAFLYVYNSTTASWINVTPSETVTLSQVSDVTADTTEVNILDVSVATPSDGNVLTYNTVGGLNWATPTDLVGISNLVEDTTPQLGGTLDANGNIIDMGTYTVTDAKVGQWDTAYGWGDHSTVGYLTSYTETDPVYTASTWYSTTNNATNWDTAYGWGDHSTAGYVSTTSDETISGSKRGTVVDNTASLSFDMNAGNNFKTTPTATGAITFTNITSGQSGNIYLNNATPVVISAATTTHIASADLTTINSAGAYWLSYYSPDGTNVYVATTPATTSQGL